MEVEKQKVQRKLSQDLYVTFKKNGNSCAHRYGGQLAIDKEGYGEK